MDQTKKTKAELVLQLQKVQQQVEELQEQNLYLHSGKCAVVWLINAL